MEDQEGLIQALKAKLVSKQQELNDVRNQLTHTKDEVCQLRDEVLELVDQINAAATRAGS